MRLSIEHVTRYRYRAPATYSVQTLRLTPLSFNGQQVIDWRVSCEPSTEFTQTADGFGNTLHVLTLDTPHEGIAIRAGGTVDVEDRAGMVQGLAEYVPPRVFLKTTPLTAPEPSIWQLAEAVGKQDTLPWLHALMAAIREKVSFKPGMTDAGTTAAQALAAGEGVCQDHAHIFIAAARSARIPARYVTGYLLTDDAEATAPAHHAWAEALVEGLGWVGFDVANVVCPTDRYVRLAASLDARFAAPIRGTRRGGEGESLDVEVTVRKLQQQQQQQQQNSQQ